MMDRAAVEVRAIELYLEDDLPHDKLWTHVSEDTREEYRQRAYAELEHERDDGVQER
jgi:hypothetical protein